MSPGESVAAQLTAEQLHACLESPSWVAAVLADAPYPTAPAWTAAAADAFDALPDGEVARALAAHPRIGESPKAATTTAAFSRGEQSAVTVAGDEVKAAIAEGNRAYEERFGRVFLIRAAGRTPQEILAAQRERLANDDATELAVARGELRQIMLLRLEALLESLQEKEFGE